MMTCYQRSFLKWAGGKYSALDSIFQTVPRAGEHFIEPFVGSATVALNTDYKHYTLSDSNPVLIHLYKMVVRDPSSVIEQLRVLFVPENNERSRYYAIKNQFNKSSDMDEKAILFVYLNRHCYNGLMRFSKRKGEFNTSFGRYKNIKIPEREIIFFAEKFKNATFLVSSFLKLNINQATSNKSVVYCDPPYLEVSKTANFTAYSQDDFSQEDHVSLDASCAQWRSLGYKSFVSNSDVSAVSQLYTQYRSKKKFDVRRSISQKGNSRNHAKEILLCYGR